MTLIAPSQWLADLVKQSFLKEYPVEVVRNTIDKNVFKPTIGSFRGQYGLENKKLLLGVAKTVVITILDDCKLYLGNYYHNGLITGTVLAFFYCLSLLFSSARHRGDPGFCAHCAFAKAPVAAVFGFYCYLVLGITVLSRETGTVYILHPIPFSTWGSEPGFLVLWVENILMTVPLGILLYILWMPFRRASRTLLAGCLFSLMIECTQLFMRLGKFETDDIINNVFGTLAGFLFCKFISWLWIRIRRKSGGYKNWPSPE